MKKTMIMLIALVSVSAINATVLTNEQIIKGFKNSLKLNRILYDGLLNSTTEFSQEEYDVGDTIDVTIHFEVNTTKNTEGLKFAVVDYKNKTLYGRYYDRYDHVTKRVIEYQKEEFEQSTAICKFIKSDSDLILSNENPSGDYHITFKLTKKCRVWYFMDEPYPYAFNSLLLYAFTEAKKYPYITEYTECRYGCSNLRIPIKLHPAARIYEKPSKTPGTGTGKPKRKPRTKQTPVKIGRGEKDILQVVHAFVFNV